MGALLRQFFSNNPPPTTDASGQVDPTRLAASLLSQLAGKGQLQMRQHVDQVSTERSRFARTHAER